MMDIPESPPSDDDSNQDYDSAPSINSPSPNPVESPVTPHTSETPASPPASEPAPSPFVSDHSKSKGFKKALVLLILLAIIAGGAYAAYTFLHSSNKPTVAAKKDIPLLTYGLSDGTLSQPYPLGDNATSAMVQVNAQLFEGLVRYEQQTKIVPLLATTWYNPNDTTWVFNLRQGVKFHSGRTLTAQDVKYSLDYAVAHQDDSNSAAALSQASTIKSVTVVNNSQVKITTDGPDPTLLNRLASLYILDSKAKLGDPDAGTGPYVITPGSKSSSSSISLSAVNNYWGGHVYTRAVHISANTNESQLGAATAKGQFDLAGTLNDGELAKIKLPHSIINVPDTGVFFLGLNTLKAGSPLESLAARQAAADALNIPAILKAGGLHGEQASQLVPPTIPGHDPSIRNIVYDPVKAKQLLATVKDASTPLNLIYPAGDDGQVAEIAKELNAVGFNVKITPISDIGSLVTTGFGGQTDIFAVTYTSDILDGLDIVSNIVIGNQDYNNAQIDTLANQASSTLDPATRIGLLQKIAKQVSKDVPDIPLYTQTRQYALLKPYHVQVDIPSTEAGVYFWQVYQ
jgi:peptide/nickel transport system substrate-binding protein